MVSEPEREQIWILSTSKTDLDTLKQEYFHTDTVPYYEVVKRLLEERQELLQREAAAIPACGECNQ